MSAVRLDRALLPGVIETAGLAARVAATAEEDAARQAIVNRVGIPSAPRDSPTTSPG